MRIGVALMIVLLPILHGSEECHNSVDNLIQDTLSNHPSIALSRQTIIGADAQVAGAKWGYYPTPSIDVTQSSGRRGTTFRVDQPLWTGGKIDASVGLAQAPKVESEIGLHESAYTLTSNFFTIVQNYTQAQRSIEVLKDGKKQLEAFEAMVNRRIDAGVSSQADKELIRSRLNQINADLTAATLKQDVSRSQLELLMGNQLQCDTLIQPRSTMKNLPPFEVLLSQMKAYHPTLKKLSAQIKTAEAERVKAQVAVWPNVSLRAEHQSGSIYYDQSVTNNLIYLAVQASPGAGLSAMSNIESAQSKVLQIQYEKLSKERELTDLMMRDYNDYRTAVDRMEGMQKTIDASQKVLDSFTRLFIAGKRQWLDLVNTSREVTQNKLAVADLEATLVVSSYRLALETGELKLETNK